MSLLKLSRLTHCALAVGFLGIAAGASAQVDVLCPGANCKVTDSSIANVDCGTYTESLYSPPATGVANNLPEVRIDYTKRQNCSKTNETHTFTYSYVDQEQITHSASGDLKVEAGLKTGVKDVVEVGLSHATTASNGWQKVDSYSTTITHSVTFDVAPCSGKKIEVWGYERKGDHKGKARIDFYVNVRYSFTFEFVTLSGECKFTTSNAIGSKKYLGVSTRSSSFTPNC